VGFICRILRRGDPGGWLRDWLMRRAWRRERDRLSFPRGSAVASLVTSSALPDDMFSLFVWLDLLSDVEDGVWEDDCGLSAGSQTLFISSLLRFPILPYVWFSTWSKHFCSPLAARCSVLSACRPLCNLLGVITAVFRKRSMMCERMYV
jgi:hypothetical protein